MNVPSKKPGARVSTCAHLVGHHAVDRGVEVRDSVRPGHHHGSQSGNDAAVSANVCPHVAVDRGSQAQQRSVALGCDLHFAQHLAGVVGRGQMLHPVFHPLHRKPQLERREGDQEVFGVELAAHPEAAAHVRLDEVDALFLDLQVAGQYRSVGVGDFGRPPDPHLPVPGVVARYEAPCLHWVGGVPVGAELLPADVVGIAEGCLNVADADFGGAGQIGAVGRMHDHRIGQRLGNVGYRRKRLVVHQDEVDGVLGQVAAPGDHHRHRLSGVAHGVGGQRRLQVLVQPRQGKHAHGDGLGQIGDIGVGEHRRNAVKGQGG